MYHVYGRLNTIHLKEIKINKNKEIAVLMMALSLGFVSLGGVSLEELHALEAQQAEKLSSTRTKMLEFRENGCCGNLVLGKALARNLSLKCRKQLSDLFKTKEKIREIQESYEKGITLEKVLEEEIIRSVTQI